MPDDRPRGDLDGGSGLGDAAQFAGVGIQFAATIVVFTALGWWLDQRLGTVPLLLISGVFVGAGAGFYALYRQLVIKPRERQNRNQRGT